MHIVIFYFYYDYMCVCICILEMLPLHHILHIFTSINTALYIKYIFIPCLGYGNPNLDKSTQI